MPVCPVNRGFFQENQSSRKGFDKGIQRNDKMRTSNYRKNLKLNKKAVKILAGSLAGLLLAGVIAFFVYFHVEHVEVMVSDRYTADEIKDMVLRGPLAGNSVLAPMLYSNEVENVPFVDGFEVKQVNRNTIAIGVREKQPVGCLPFLDCYMYFDRTGKIIESSTEREEKIPYFDGLEVDQVALNEDLAIKEESVLNTAVSLARIFEKNDLIPDHILFDEKYQITLEYGEIRVQLGKDSFLEDKMARLIAILPKLNGQKGILHMESVDANVKTITFEKEVEEQKAASTGEVSEDGEEDTSQDGEQEDGSDSDETWEDYEEDSYGEDYEEDSYEENYEEDSYEENYEEDSGDSWEDTGDYDEDY